MLFVIVIVDGANVIQTYYNVNESTCICYNNSFLIHSIFTQIVIM